MRGLAAGLGTRISSMLGLLIVAVVEIHRPDLGLNVHPLLSSDAILLVKSLVCPSAVPRLLWNPRVRRTKCVLGNFPNRHQKAKEPSRDIASDASCRLFSRERPRNQVRLCAYRAR